MIKKFGLLNRLHFGIAVPISGEQIKRREPRGRENRLGFIQKELNKLGTEITINERVNNGIKRRIGEIQIENVEIIVWQKRMCG